MSENSFQGKQTFTDLLRVKFKGLLDSVAHWLLDKGITANQVTVSGLVFHFIAAYLAATGKFLTAGLVLLVLAPTDAIDGTMARLSGSVSSFGAFLDSVVDRYCELILYAGLAYYGVSSQNGLFTMLAFASAAGSIMVSYARAKAEGTGFEVKVGLLSRVERYIVLIPFLIIGNPLIALWILAIFTNFTAIQRILVVKKLAQQRDKSNQ